MCAIFFGLSFNFRKINNDLNVCKNHRLKINLKLMVLSGAFKDTKISTKNFQAPMLFC